MEPTSPPTQALRHARCPECGYGLHGLTLDRARVTCPECGTQKRLSEVLDQRPPMSRTRALLLCCAWTPLLWVTAAIALIMASPPRELGFPLILIVGVLIAVVVPPLVARKRIARRERGLWMVPAIVVSLLCNALLGAAEFVVLFILSWR